VCVHQQFHTISQYSNKGQITAEMVQNIPSENEKEKKNMETKAFIITTSKQELQTSQGV
jgi:hypothetical protein